jgi:hypothetical protein
MSTAKTWTPGQMACALGEISNTARVLERIAIMNQCADIDGDPLDSEALSYASQYLAQRVGWLADMAAECSAPDLVCGDIKTPLRWSMTPLFFQRSGGHQ